MEICPYCLGSLTSEHLILIDTGVYACSCGWIGMCEEALDREEDQELA